MLDSEFYFIRIGGQGGVHEALPHFLGPLGGLISAYFKKRAEKNAAGLISTVDQSHPQLHIRKHQHNFKLNAATVRASRIKPPAFLSLHGTHVGRWMLALRNGKKMVFQFENSKDMHVAIVLLPNAIGQVLSVDVEWSERKNAYVKRRR
ncbi:MAG: hypothetical protein R3268_09505 [Acidiferrobacterales bacterium]|nr:hypothetical protein [Acidiferrobacterales bacterium]